VLTSNHEILILENAKFLTSLVEDDLKFKDPKSIVNGHVMDCQLTAICSDRFLPKAIDDFAHDNDDSNFTNLFDFVSSRVLLNLSELSFSF